MQKGQIAIQGGTNSEILPPKVESVEKLDKKIEKKDRELRALRKETKGLIDELDYAYKTIRKTQEESVLKKRLSVAGGIAAGIAHELRNSLNIIGISAQYLHNKFNPGDDRREFTETIMNKIDKLNSLTTDLLRYANPHKPNFTKNDIHKILERCLKLVEFKRLLNKVKTENNYSSKLSLVEVDDELIGQLFLNLFDNAFWAMPEGGKLVITTRSLIEKNIIEIKIADTGCGISGMDIPHIFDPFFTLKEDGTGLGLSIAHRIVNEHKGNINVKSELDKGTTFIIRLPISQKK